MTECKCCGNEECLNQDGLCDSCGPYVDKLKHELARVCKWTPMFEDSYGDYDTSCSSAFTFMDAGVKENGFKFCPYCGGVIEEIKEAEE